MERFLGLSSCLHFVKGFMKNALLYFFFIVFPDQGKLIEKKMIKFSPASKIKRQSTQPNQT